jgi:uncharacterized protein
MAAVQNIQYGLSDRDVKTIRNIFQKYSDVITVHIFGSRAKGNYKPGSDIDLAIMNTPLEEKTLMCLKNDFEESSLPYMVDLVHFPTLSHPEFIEHIQRVGKLFYNKD